MPTSPRSRFRFLWPVLLMATVAFASSREVAPMGPELAWLEIDKLAHVLIYGLLATLWLRALTGERATARTLLAAWLLAVGFGLIDELIQSFNPLRQASLADGVADAVGATVALLAYVGWSPYRRLLETPLARRRARPTA